MIKRSTHSDLISYAYNETGLRDGDRIQRAIDGDPVVQDEFKDIVKVMETLDEAKPVVSDDVIARIMKHA